MISNIHIYLSDGRLDPIWLAYVFRYIKLKAALLLGIGDFRETNRDNERHPTTDVSLSSPSELDHLNFSEGRTQQY